MRIIRDKSTPSTNLYRAGSTFIKLLFGEKHQPTEIEVAQIVEFICTHPSVPLENLISVSAMMGESQKKND